MTLSPNSAQTVDQSQTLSLTATVANDSKNAGVQWALTGPGTLSAKTAASVTYTAAAATGGTPATVTATSVADTTKSASVRVTVNPAPSVTTTSVPAATVGVAYSATITAAGGTSPFTWAIASGNLPAGLSLGSSTTNSVTISGTPTTVGSSSAMLQVTDATHASTSQAVPFLVNAPQVVLVRTTLVPGVINIAYSQTLMAQSGVPPYVWSLASGTLPAGLSLNSSSGVISGTPTAAGSSSFVVKVTDTNTPTPSSATENLSLTINPALAITTTTLPAGSVDSGYAQPLMVTGGLPPYTFSIASGSLPTGLHLEVNGDLIGGVIEGIIGGVTGTPTATGTSSFTVAVRDTYTTVDSGSLSITIDAANCPNNAKLKGNYAFLVHNRPNDDEIGSIVSDGAGNITSEFADFNNLNNVSMPQAVTGTYCITSNNLGTLTLSYPGVPNLTTSTLTIAVQADGNARVALFDDFDGTFATNPSAVGVVLKQDPTAFSLSKITGNYAFGLAGSLSQSNNVPPGALIGAFSADGQGNLTNGQTDGQFPFTATDFVVSSTGRGTFTIGQPPQFSWTFYIVDSSHLLAIASHLADSHFALYDFFAGEIVQQTGGPYTNASLSGVSVFETQAAILDSSPPSSVARVGFLTADGAGNFSVTADQNNNGTLSSPAFSGTYSVSPNGLVTLNITGQPAANAITLYLTAPNQAFLAGFGDGSFGALEPQSGVPFTNASFSGSYFGASSPASSSVENEVDALNADGAGNVSGVIEFTGEVTDQFTATPDIPATGSISGNYSTAANGRGMLTQSGTQSYVFYVVSPTKVVLLPATITNPYLVPMSH